jgi:predicted glycosyltransferase
MRSLKTDRMMRLMVYSHDAFGLGNIRRMMAICEYLLKAIPNLSILLVSGSPMLQGFRLPQGLDYIKLPCLNRGEAGDLSVKYLGTDVETTISLRSELILAAVRHFQPNVLMVDKKPFGLKGELRSTIDYLQIMQPETQLVLLLRDILDSPETTKQEWQQHNFYEAVERFYDQVLVVGMPEVFDVCQEYQFPELIAQKVQHCGYIRKEPGQKSRLQLRRELGLQFQEKLVLVTPGGGEDGFRLMKTYVEGVDQLDETVRSILICGPEMPSHQREQLSQMIKQNLRVQLEEFSDDLMSYMDAADAVVSMSGYNTVSEVLSLLKCAIVVPRTKPGKEQLIRAERMAEMGLLRMIHPDQLTSEHLMDVVVEELSRDRHAPVVSRLDLQALPRIAQQLSTLFFNPFASQRQLFAKKNVSSTELALSGASKN